MNRMLKQNAMILEIVEKIKDSIQEYLMMGLVNFQQ